MAAVAAPARRVGRFVLIEVLGRGAQATVWRAHDERLDRDIAIKLLDTRADTVVVSQWLHEARAVSRLAHPHIVPVFEADDQGGQPYLVFELVRGMTLSEQLRKTGAMAATSAVQVMIGVLDALSAAHAEGIVHRDLKPSNILIDLAGRPRVMDFGIAARVSDQADGRIIGTPGYMSPEAAVGAPPAPAMDIFSAAMVLAEMLTGRPLVRESDPLRALKRICTEDFGLPDHVACNDGLRAVVRRALSRGIATRYASAQELGAALRAFIPQEVASGPEGSDATLDFLLRRMRSKSDFPTLSKSVGRIQRVATSDTESLASLSSEILKDVALTNKLLRLVNTAHFSNAGGGTISTVSRAVALVGFAGVRNMALSLVLLEHMQDKAHAARLREEFVGSLMAAQLANELTPWTRDAEDAYLAALFQNLGKLLAEFYFPEEAQSIRNLPRPSSLFDAVTADWLETASERILGIGFEPLGIGIARSWGLPDSLQRAMRRPEGDPPKRAVERGVDRHRWLAAASNDMATALMGLEPPAAESRIEQLAEHYAKAMNLPASAFLAAVVVARQKLSQMIPALGLVVTAGSPTQRLLTPLASGCTVAADTLSPHALQATAVVEPSIDAPTEVIALAADEIARLLGAGIQDITDTMASESFRLNEVLRMILETMFRALRFRRIVFCLRDPRTQRLTGRFGLGDGIEPIARCFEVSLTASAGSTPDLFSAVCNKGADTLIADSSDARIYSRLPAWYSGHLAAPCFLLLPLTMKGAPFALIYADCATAGGISLEERELGLLRTLRNQAVMAFRQSN